MDRTTWFCRRLILLGFVLSVCPGLVGCGGSSGVKTQKVTGKVTDSGGGPVKGATVTFTGSGSKAYSASGVTGDDGSYSLATNEPGDGAPPGEYAIAISDANGQGLKPTPSNATVADKANTIDLKVEGSASAAPPAAP